ncbi:MULTISPECIES: polysaccharide deacetylase [Halorussus]|uniref:polysaccharide deacetylase family protein n=1 Tax=Halorussus TaxID=1070314 RepID=UPI000E20D9F6|nr:MULTISPECIES: polysaccharide deacetylase [Halorussus]NHN61622.1 polysaccharide deacetylase [Halorussus sp. JP-T4]
MTGADSGATVCLTVDFDAVSAWIHSFDEADSPTNLSRGLFGADVGAPRLLALLDEYDLSTTWFVPGHTVESFPEVVEEVWAGGHEIEHHGWSHTRPSNYADRASERADIERGIDAIESLTGRRPAGYRSPSWDFSPNTLGILRELGFAWDSSQMAHDFEPYRLREGWRAPADAPYERGEPTDVVEVPVSWQRDDFPALAFSRQRGFAVETAVFDMWRRQFDWIREHVDGGVYVLTVHPQVVGQSHRLANLESLLDHMVAADDVAFETVDSVVAGYSD